jgi:LytS/YehU family sensor histidine kinase
MEAKFQSLKLETLESRLNPHLFKNILNSVQSHAYQTYFALDKLSNVLAYILYDSREKLVSPREEIAFALDLIEINKVKLSPLFELNVKSRINEDEPLYSQPLLAPLVSIELIENAFKHADLQSGDGFISIVFEFRNDQFYLTVSNKIAGSPPLVKEKGGLGFTILSQRLNLIYGSNYKLDHFVEGNVFVAHLKINLLEHKAKMLAAG